MIGLSQDRVIVHCDCNNRGVGIALIVNTNLNPKQIRMNTILDIVAVQISEPIQMIVISVYRSPSTPIDVFMNNMLDIIVQFQNVPTCVVGDFNEDVSITSNTHCCTMFRLQGFQQIISKPTHHSGTIIDHVYMSHTLNTIQTDVTDCYYKHNCLIDMYHILVKHSYKYHEYHMIHTDPDKILWQMKKCANISNTCQFGTMSHHQTHIHLMNMSL